MSKVSVAVAVIDSHYPELKRFTDLAKIVIVYYDKRKLRKVQKFFRENPSAFNWTPWSEPKVTDDEEKPYWKYFEEKYGEEWDDLSHYSNDSKDSEEKSTKTEKSRKRRSDLYKEDKTPFQGSSIQTTPSDSLSIDNIEVSRNLQGQRRNTDPRASLSVDSGSTCRGSATGIGSSDVVSSPEAGDEPRVDLGILSNELGTGHKARANTEILCSADDLHSKPCSNYDRITISGHVYKATSKTVFQGLSHPQHAPKSVGTESSQDDDTSETRSLWQDQPSLETVQHKAHHQELEVLKTLAQQQGEVETDIETNPKDKYETAPKERRRKKARLTSLWRRVKSLSCSRRRNVSPR